MSTPPGHIVLGIQAFLMENGTGTAAEIARALGVSRQLASAALTRMNREGAGTPKRIHITAWVYEDDGRRRYPRAVYASGGTKDKPKPRRDTHANSRRYRERNKGQVTSVFDLARPGRGRRALVTGRPSGSTP